jgi:Holliday junction resolvasome RuvABC endonuclease subunit
MNTLLAIDPSINNCGIALFQKGNKRWELINATVTKPDKEDETIVDRMYTITLQISKFLVDRLTFSPFFMVIEIPGYQYIDTNKKSIELLNKTIGFIEGCYCLWWKIIEVPVSEWKGNRPKEETRIIVEHDYPMVKKLDIANSIKHNAIDAIGLGDWWIKKYEIEQRIKK